MKTLTASLLALAGIALSACGGGGAMTPAPATPLANAQGHLDTIWSADLGAAATEAMPGVGNAVYAGSMGFGTADFPDRASVGTATLNVDFAAESMSGTATDWYRTQFDEEGTVIFAEAMEGSLDLGGTFSGANGVLLVSGEVANTNVLGAVGTVFQGAGAETLLGLGTADLESGGNFNTADIYLSVSK